MLNIKELSLKELEELLVSWGEKRFHAAQIFSWIYQRGAQDFSQMSNLSLALRKKLEERLQFSSLNLAANLKSSDGTEKFLFSLADNNFIEAVSIPMQKRLTGCVSSQAGCKFACSFCASGVAGFRRNLSAAEIIDQALFLNNHSHGKLTHLVFMGTGEPLDNYENVLKAIRIINSPQSLNIGARRITISTSGIIPAIRQLEKEGLQIELSVSLHAADNRTRDSIMPINKKYPLQELIAACKNYIQATNRQVTFEYILIKGLNSDLQNALNLGKILKRMNCKVNLIPANPVEELKIFPPEKKEIVAFKTSLLKSGINATLRKSRGEDIHAACGQLRLKYEKS
ncbi:MAG: 23S rRNA (adenine(2503)-C(2))-methyltransferase RlmN [Candidatus Omnitrophica bacterium]|nr:23S rRNA (adenine(2503)-C(2))-methyltransferase RlmN [Candidatus Omnitrophota bacterium]MDD5652542.1 23S rRNA (adenine(2503)-C(2))-methyltransferase RlmN [Candidatus Omnitrophota bacterium]